MLKPNDPLVALFAEAVAQAKALRERLDRGFAEAKLLPTADARAAAHKALRLEKHQAHLALRDSLRARREEAQRLLSLVAEDDEIEVEADLYGLNQDFRNHTEGGVGHLLELFDL